MMIVEDWMDSDDPLDTRMFYELMQAYRHASDADVTEAFKDVKEFVRDHCMPADSASLLRRESEKPTD
jgi:hypothetical protein